MTPTAAINEFPWPSATRPFCAEITRNGETRSVLVYAVSHDEAKRLIAENWPGWAASEPWEG